MLTTEDVRQGDRFWPSWPSGQPTASDPRILTPYQELARYVSAPAVEEVPRLKPLRSDVVEENEAADRRLAEALYDRLADLGLRYAIEPWQPRGYGRQPIRHPAWLVHLGWGTCLDVALTFAGMCVAEELAPLLAIGGGHVFVALTPGRNRQVTAPIALPGCKVEAPGVLAVSEPERLLEHARRELVPVETTCAVWRGDDVAPERFAAALDAGALALKAMLAEDLRIVDVAWLQEPKPHGFGVVPFEPPRSWLGVGMHLPDGVGDQDLFASQQAVLRALSGAHGIHVIAAEAGYGKSTVARHLVAAAPFGAGWFLGASDQRVLTNSLANAELAARNRPTSDLADIDRTGYAEAGLGRLREASHPWLVVLDNADQDPDGALRRMPLPRATDDQLLVITTTNLAWADASGYPVHRLRALTDAEVTQELADDRLASFVAGRPLLLTAFKRLAAALGIAATDIVVDLDLEPSPDNGPRAFWDAARTQALDRDGRRTGRCAAFLPPDGVSIAALDAVHGQPGGGARLCEVGLLDHVEGQSHGRLHRLFGAAITSEMGGDEAARAETAMLVASTPAATANLAELSDRPLVGRLLAALEECEAETVPPDRQLGICFHAIGGVFEMRNDTEQSARAYALALPHLDRSLAGDRPLVAECLLGMARKANQHAGDAAELREGLAWAQEAHRLMLDDGRGAQAGRFLAMQGLLEVKLAERDGRPDDEVVKGLLEGLERIKEADRLRHADPGTSPEELSRSAFNRARPYVRLADRDRLNAAQHLQEARTAYATVLAQRRRYYPHLDAHGHVAVCIWGLALVDYLTAMLVADSPAKKREALREATKNALESARQREALAGPDDDGDVSKSYRLIAKIAMARHLVPLDGSKRDGEHRKLIDEVHGELPAGGLLSGSPWPPDAEASTLPA